MSLRSLKIYFYEIKKNFQFKKKAKQKNNLFLIWDYDDKKITEPV